MRDQNLNKLLRSEKVDLEKEINSLKVSLKSAKKQVKDNSHQLEKKIASLEDVIKAGKVSEVKMC